MRTRSSPITRGLRRAGRVLALASLIATAPVSAQVVRGGLGPIVPYGDNAKVLRNTQAIDTTSIALYTAAFLGPTATVAGVSMSAQQQGFQYVSVNLVVSASTIPTPHGPDYEVMGNLRRLHEHVTLTPLDSAGQPLKGEGGLEILATLPDTILMAATSTDSTSSSAGTAVLGAVTRQFMPELAAGAEIGKHAGPAVATFLHLYHKPSAQLQVGYTSGPRDFGWLWYGKEGLVIDGTHYTSGALEVGRETRYLRVHVQVTAEWKSHGSWERDNDVVLALAPVAH